MEAFRDIDRCRASGSRNLVTVLNLGWQELTGVFPRDARQHVTSGPLELVWCADSGLLQLKHSYSPEEMYGENYGYRSGLNQSMVNHLTGKVRYLERLVALREGDFVLDIGSNDATTLKAYAARGIQRVGIDPTGSKFRGFYTSDIKLVPDFFSAEAYRSVAREPARIVTSIAMFYDLEDPVDFVRQIAAILADDGVWHLEQSYMPSMLRTNSYDTICHEHVEYYSLTALEKIFTQAGMAILDVTMNAINGGSFAVTAAKRASCAVEPNRAVIDWLLAQEDRMGLNTPRPYRDFEERVFRHRDDLVRLIRGLRADGKRVLGYGASTKGNVLLQFCGLTTDDVAAIAEVNVDKFGCVTPGTHIPIVSEADARAMKPDYFLVLPWHFKDGILRREQEYLAGGGRMIFPFPEIEIV
ncbi:MAG TPA: class I SAM-dependent methyltransferase [Casimicrobiaceae bacterium]|nr:class I SAM-dependent methyltransferase [Casimicrobiaceae bacterium]